MLFYGQNKFEFRSARVLYFFIGYLIYYDLLSIERNAIISYTLVMSLNLKIVSWITSIDFIWNIIERKLIHNEMECGSFSCGNHTGRFILFVSLKGKLLTNIFQVTTVACFLFLVCLGFSLPSYAPQNILVVVNIFCCKYEHRLKKIMTSKILRVNR